LIQFLITVALASAAVFVSQAQAPAEPASLTQSTAPATASPAASVIIHGHINDQTGALIPGAQI